jgi:DNA replication protein DnaC
MKTPVPLDDLDAMLKRLHMPTIRRLYADLAIRAEEEGMSYRTFLELLCAEEIAHRAQTRITRSVRKARFPFLRTIEEFDFTFQTSVRLQMLGTLLGPELGSEGRSAIFSGPPGRGKTHLAVAVAYRAIQNGFEARFATAAHLIEELSNAARTGRLAPALHDYTHPHVLVIDEIGYLSLKDNAANVLFQVVNERYLQRKPILFTTNKPLAAWGHVLHDPDLAEAILDRVLERGRHIQLRGPSYRTRHHQMKENKSAEPHEAPGAILSGNLVPDFPEPTPGAPWS